MNATVLRLFSFPPFVVWLQIWSRCLPVYVFVAAVEKVPGLCVRRRRFVVFGSSTLRVFTFGVAIPRGPKPRR
jgi:hypothetical protein